MPKANEDTVLEFTPQLPRTFPDGRGEEMNFKEAADKLQLMSQEEFEMFYQTCPPPIQDVIDKARTDWRQARVALFAAASFLRTRGREK